MAIQFSLRIAPPQRWVLENPKKDVRRTETCQGHRPKGAFLPPTIRISGTGNKDGTPHCIFSLFADAAIVITEPVLDASETSACVTLVDDNVVTTSVVLAELAVVLSDSGFFFFIPEFSASDEINSDAVNGLSKYSAF